MKRRDFVRLSGLAAATTLTPAGSLSMPPAEGDVLESLDGLDTFADLSPSQAATDEAYWRRVRALYAPSPDVLDFDNANTGAVSNAVVATYLRLARVLNAAPNVHYPRQNSTEAIYRDLAAFLDTTEDEVALTPNATTGLNTVLRGFPLTTGDEVLITNHEYPDMVATLHLRARRDGIVVRTVDVPSPDAPPSLLAERVGQAITPRTKLLLVSHVSAWTSEVLPIAELCAVARARGVAVLVDAAQSAGYLDVHFRTWGCDFLALSLHKGVGAPISTGALVVRKDWFGRLEPLHPPTWDTSKYPIEQYAWSGTANVAAHASIPAALRALRRVSLPRKRERLRFLADHWQSRARRIAGVRILTPVAPDRSFGFASFAIDGVPSHTVAERLRTEFGILVQDKASRPYRPVDNAVRVSPQPYTTPRELDRLVRGIAVIAARSPSR